MIPRIRFAMIDNCSSDDLVERILDETAKPPPEQPLHFRDDKERYEDRPHKNTDGSGDKSEGYDDDGNGLSCGKQDDDDHVHGRSQDVCDTGRVHARLKVRNSLLHGLEFGLIDCVGQKLGLVGNEVMETGPHTRNGRAVVIDHREAKADSQKKTCEVVEVEEVSASGR